jgi:hypothetical protein
MVLCCEVVQTTDKVKYRKSLKLSQIEWDGDADDRFAIGSDLTLSSRYH